MADELELLDIGLHVIEDEPRVLDVELGERLGMAQPRDIRVVIRRNEEELLGFGSLRARTANHTELGGRPATAYFLNEEQAVLLSMLSRAPRAKEARAMIVKVFMAWRRGQLPSVSEQKIMAEINGIARMLSHKVTVIEKEMIPAVMAAVARLATPSPDIALTRDYVPSFEVVATMAGVPADRRYSGLSAWVSNQLQKFCGRNGYQPKLVNIHPGEKWLFPRDATLRWLDEGGRASIMERVRARQDKKNGQGRLKLVDPR